MLKPIHLPISFFTSLTTEDFRQFQSRSIDGNKSVGSIDRSCSLHQFFPWDHHLWKEIPEAAECSRLNQWVGHFASLRVKRGGVKTLNLNLNNCKLLNDRKARFGGSKIAVVIKNGIGVFFDLFRRFEIPVKGIPIVILAIYGCIILADLGTGFVNAAPVVFAKMFAGTVNEEEPVIVFCEHRGIFILGADTSGYSQMPVRFQGDQWQARNIDSI